MKWRKNLGKRYGGGKMMKEEKDVRGKRQGSEYEGMDCIGLGYALNYSITQLQLQLKSSQSK